MNCIFPSRHMFGDDVKSAIAEVFDFYHDSDFGYQGEFERRYTDAFAGYLGGGYADAVSSGTAAVFVALAALELPKGSTVLLSAVTDPGTFNAIVMQGYRVSLVDAGKAGYNTDIDSFKDAIARHPSASAAVLVHTGGKPISDIAMICKVAKANGIKVLEDVSQAHGAEIDGQKAGTFGDIAAFSTMYRKNHASGGCGGIVYTKDERLYRSARAYADRGKPYGSEFDEKNPANFLFPALNFNQDELSCAIGLATLKKLDEIRQKRIWFLKYLRAKCEEIGTQWFPAPVCDGDSPFFWVFEPTLDCGIPKEVAVERLKAAGVPINPDYRYIVDEWPFAKPYLDGFLADNARKYRNGAIHLLFHEFFEFSRADCIAEILTVGGKNESNII
jgi:perosamine synthetase